ncbi:MAG: type methionyl aminopeptidase [Frankiales bacterium]|nr:type methionyl aminopeptidase [Frankiales bacterium]
MTALPLRTSTELDAMRAAGRVVADTLQAVRAAAVPGVRLRELDELAQTVIRDAGALPSFLGYRPVWAPTPFNGALCLSPNEIVVHGRPNGRRLRDGDLLSIDCGAIADGWHGDSAVTVHVGADPDDDDLRLMTATELALGAGIAAAVPGATLLDVATAVDAVARAHGFTHLPDHGGHGIGREMHEAPFVPNEPTRDAARHRLHAGNTIAIEPMLHAGTGRYRTKKDGWSIAMVDGKRAAHFEHTVAITDDGPEVLTATSP